MTESKQSMTREEAAAYARGYRKGKGLNKNEKKIEELLVLLGSDVKELGIEMIRASMSNPLLGIFTAIVSVDILEQIKVIRPATAWGLYAAIGVMEGAGAAADVIKSFESIFGGAKGTTSLVQPSATTLVLGSKKDDLQALLKDVNKQ